MAKKGNIPWNKGLTKENDVRVNKYSEKLKKPKLKKELKYVPPQSEWVINCSNCGKPKPPCKSFKSYSTSLRKFNRGNGTMCKSCKDAHLSKVYPVKKDALLKNPDSWKIQCNQCQEYILFDNYNNFQNTKSRIKRENKYICACCRKSNNVISDDPLTWHIPCSFCNTLIYYNNISSFRTRYGAYKSGKTIYCKICNIKKYENLIRKDAIYSYNPDDWKIKCFNKNCDNIIKYTTRKTFSAAKKLENEGKGRICLYCCGRRARRKNILLNRFKPGYNYRSIDFIETVLNNQFNCKFQHAESENGEFYIDDGYTRFYADAFCEELNLWIEFDEHYKFIKGKLPNKQIERHNFIKKNTNYNIIRFHCNKKYEFNEYYNDITKHGLNLNEKFNFVNLNIGK